MQKTLSTIILEKLATGTKPVGALVRVVAKEESVTIQGVYKALRVLKTEGVVTIYNKHVSLSLIWLDIEQRRLERITQLYLQEQYLTKSIATKRSKVKFTFHTLRELDHFWVQSFTILTEEVAVSEISYSIHPHDWYYYADLDSDAFWITKHARTSRISRVVLTHAAGLDFQVMRQRKVELGELFQFTVGVNPQRQPSHIHYNVVGPYVFTATFDLKIAKQLDAFIMERGSLPLSSGDKKDLQHIIDTEGKHTLTIEQSDTKANILRQSVRKYFEF